MELGKRYRTQPIRDVDGSKQLAQVGTDRRSWEESKEESKGPGMFPPRRSQSQLSQQQEQSESPQ